MVNQLKIYTTTKNSKILDFLSSNGFYSCKRLDKDELWVYPEKSGNYWDVIGWFCKNHVDGFMIDSEPVIKNLRENGQKSSYSLARYFEQPDLIKYHALTHKLPESIITTADESLVDFLKIIQNETNPFLKLINQLEEPIIFHKGKAYSANALDKIGCVTQERIINIFAEKPL